MLSCSLSSAIFALLLLTAAEAANLTLYDLANSNGVNHNLNIFGCVDLPACFDNLASSLTFGDGTEMIYLCKDKGCKNCGLFSTSTPTKLANLALAGFDNSVSSVRSVTILNSTQVTNWGVWKPWYFCDEGEYAQGFSARFETIGGNDNTALNSIHLACNRPPSTRNGQNYHDLPTPVGNWGDWSLVSTCPSGNKPDDLLAGFMLKVLPPQPGDDMAATGIQMICSAPIKQNGVSLHGPEALNYGKWSLPQYCPAGERICGLRLQIEPPQGSFTDDTSLNNVDFACCPLP